MLLRGCSSKRLQRVLTASMFRVVRIQPQFTSRLRFADEAHTIVAGQFVPAELEIEYTGMGCSQRGTCASGLTALILTPGIFSHTASLNPPPLPLFRHGCPGASIAASSENQPLALDAVGSRYARVLRHCCMSLDGCRRVTAALSDSCAGQGLKELCSEAR